MAWEWLVIIDGALGLGVAAVAVYLAAVARRHAAALFFSLVAFMATFRIFYFILPALFDLTPSAGVAGVFPGTENVLGIALVGAMLALREDGLKGVLGRTLISIVYVAGLAAVLLQFQDSASTLQSYLAPLFLATAFVVATGTVAAEWVAGGNQTPRRELVFILGPLFAWSLNDALRIGHGAWALPSVERSTLAWFTLVVSVCWLGALLVVAAAIIQDMILRDVGAIDRKLLVVLMVGAMMALFQLLTADPNGMRAIHLILDCLAILAVGASVAARARTE